MIDPASYASASSSDDRNLVRLFTLVPFTQLTYLRFACANFIATAISIGNGWTPSPGPVLGIYAAVLASQGLINTFGVRLLKDLNNIAVWWNAIGTIAVIITVLVTAPTRQSGKFVFRTFIDGTGVDGVGWSERASPAYVVVIGVLFAQYSLTGVYKTTYTVLDADGIFRV